MHVKNCILGAGPTGLGAGHRLTELGEHDFVILERESHVGGLSASFQDDAGFTWDLGGHVVFSHYEYFDRVLDSLLGEDALRHQRIARVRIAGAWVPYPFQNNIRHLPGKLVWECVEGLVTAHERALTESAPAGDFAEWIDRVFGAGIARLFMRPYNFKVWATPPERMQAGWIGERVSVVDLRRVLENIILEKDDVCWGPNNTFRFPLEGGTGAIYTRLAAPFIDRIRLSTAVARVDAASKTVRTADGLRITYENLLNTTPLDLFAGTLLDDAPDALRKAAALLEHNSVFVTGVGVAGTRDDDTCWMYFPEDDSPFYRTTNFHNYSPRNVPAGVAARALMAETSFSAHKMEDQSTIMDRTVDGLVSSALMEDSERDAVLTRWEKVLPYGYPVPTLDRDRALAAIQPWLETRSICSRGRFGGWRYEVANMDHSVMQGKEWADRVTRGDQETTYTIPTT
ncbi:amine oxidase [Oceanidesulfovibrio indonesiensis]|uniref:Amine oxidase n=1 Tax=Oceanidesulfovibrio indonesiensis TaxID=54767 RepID=A0A7M3MGW7_9BACT|nr:FAD-dependent oxidoreductase [Oceanidesulfovibrio indonesiensis]TVM18725.1 amine oxidase [Oceanidesulfovibrio indonesiensis]